MDRFAEEEKLSKREKCKGTSSVEKSRQVLSSHQVGQSCAHVGGQLADILSATGKEGKGQKESKEKKILAHELSARKVRARDNKKGNSSSTDL